jgi:hypothetical protein
MSNNLLKRIRNYTGFTISRIQNLISKAPYSYKKFHIPKNSGGRRRIDQPTKETKAMQYALNDIYFENLPVHSIAYAYKKIKSPIRKVASLHKDTSYTLKIDFEKFFPSIKFDDLKKTLSKSDKYDFSKTELKYIRNICFINSNQGWNLSIGAPTSPILSNIIMYELDEKIYELALSVNNEAKISRYADDIAFSTDKKESSKEFLEEMEELLSDIDSPNLDLNDDKTNFLSRASRRIIAGLVITPDGKVSIGRSKKRKIKSLVNSFKYDLLDMPEIHQLRGYLSFIKDVEPNFYTRLVIKYGSEVIENIYENP